MEISISPSKPEVAIFSVGIRFLRMSVAFFEAHTPTSNTQLENNPQIASADNIGYERPAIEAKTACEVSVPRSKLAVAIKKAFVAKIGNKR